MSNKDIRYAACVAIDEARLYLTRAYAANDPEIQAIAKTVIEAVTPLLREAIRAEVIADLEKIASETSDAYEWQSGIEHGIERLKDQYAAERTSATTTEVQDA